MKKVEKGDKLEKNSEKKLKKWRKKKQRRKTNELSSKAKQTKVAW